MEVMLYFYNVFLARVECFRMFMHDHSKTSELNFIHVSSSWVLRVAMLEGAQNTKHVI